VRVFVAGLAQAHRQIHQTGYHDAAGSVDGVVSMEIRRYIFYSYNHPIGKGYIGNFIEPAGRIYDPTAFN